MKDKQDWEKRYAEKFPNIHGRKLPLQLKSFIQSELDRQRKSDEKLIYDIFNNIIKSLKSKQ